MPDRHTPTASERCWCHLTPTELAEEALTDLTFRAVTHQHANITVTATGTTLTLIAPQPDFTSLPVLMEATMNPDGTYTGSVWILPVAYPDADMQRLALTVHHALNPPDVSGEILFSGALGNWMNFIRFLYRITYAWAREHTPS